MKLNAIDIRTVMGARAVDVLLETPITIFAGGNGSGKSSTLECVRMALGEDPLRVSLKKEYAALVTEGAKNGRVNVVCQGETYGISFPDGKRYGPVEPSLYLSYALDPALFASLSDDARRTMLFHLTGCQVTGAKVTELLVKRGCNAEKIEHVIPKLGGGFPAAVEFAKEQARQSKADWKAITNEAWGANKAESWQAPVPEFDAKQHKSLSTQIDGLAEQATAAAVNLGKLQEQRKQHEQWMQGEATRKAQIEKLPTLRKKLALDEAELKQWEDQVKALEGRAGDGPRVGLVHELAFAVSHLLAFVDPEPNEDDARAQKALDTYEVEYGPIGSEGDSEAAAKLPEARKARDLMQRSVDNDRRDISAAELAANQQNSTESPPAVTQSQVDECAKNANDLRQQREALEQQRKTLDRAAEAVKVAAANTAKAASYNADISQWLELADALSPDGIPGEMLSSALKPVNDRLREAAEATGWMQAAIGADMAVTADGRPYALLCESEQWRVDAMLSEMVSHLSGLKLLVLDRADVLEPAARPELLGWLDALAVDGAIDTALVGITLKKPPTGLPDTMTAHWLQEGQLLVETAEVAEVA